MPSSFMTITVHDGIGPWLDRAALYTAMNVAEAAQSGAAEMQAYAQSNAPWADDSGMARAGLTASVSVDGGVVVIELAHGVDYGYWLEVIQDGQYAILLPTLEALGPQVIQDAGMAVVGNY